jgi:hypothetical protein
MEQQLECRWTKWQIYSGNLPTFGLLMFPIVKRAWLPVLNLKNR